MTLTSRLMEVSRDIWEAEKQHPFVRGLGDGSLPAETFRFYLEQDYLFLIEYAKVFSIAATRAPEPAMMAQFANLAAETLNVEMDLHRSYCAEFGITPADLEQVEMAQTTSGYTGHLLSVAMRGDVADIIAAVLPCQWGYAEISRHLQAGGMPPEPRYVKWIEMYASDAFDDYGRWLRETLDGMQGITPEREARLKRIFRDSSRWEALFWEMAWQQAMWEV